MARTIRKAGVKEVSLSEVKDDLSRYLREADPRHFQPRAEPGLQPGAAGGEMLPDALPHGAEAAEHYLTDLMSDLPAMDRLS